MPSTPLITLSPPDRHLDRTLLEAPGGFVWWYVDLVDENGDGLVLIWSYGLPFLPGYAQAAREGRAQTPRQRPSVNLSVYKEGRLDFYLLQELEPDQAHWSRDEGSRDEGSRDDDSWRFGDCRMQRKIVDGRLRLEVDLDCPIDGADDRLRGHIELDGVFRQLCDKPGRSEVVPDELAHHDWTPLVGPARGVAELAHGDDRWHIEGRAYHDRNGGSIPQHDLGIDHWIWGRVPLADRELIYYLLWEDPDASPVCFGLTIDDEGRTERVEDLHVDRGRARKNVGGLRWWPRLEISCAGQPWLSVHHRDVVDSGPFYMRYITEVTSPVGQTSSGQTSSGQTSSGQTSSGQTSNSQTVRGVGELCEPERVDLGRHRPLVRMRVHDLGGDNSMWLPLFTGPKTGRVRRLLSSWVPGSWAPGSWLGGGGR